LIIFPIDKISSILTLLTESRIRNVEIYLKHDNKIKLEKYISFIEKFHIVSFCVIHSSPLVDNSEYDRLFFTEEKILSSSCCGKISKNNFVINLPFYLEGIKHNTCLNRKLSISDDGSIKNCPSMNDVFGNIKNHSIEKIVSTQKFKKYWNINKDMINTCKDCEFRKICSDCRAYLNNPYDKPFLCTYNPYTMLYSE
jgi:SPASM domain peptide maturase of grasp-with-spasm system